ncbi:uncharacterized protein M421DRAFT_244925 [Didymella exigua CBS 183.55]|uniref:Uncharacterized protein n=1 Tax=Didymella exigua CBS 183.55 TaxID=1150837 RepID=A0A6A5S004_9PLEO|nr:uncharacterized protein M421DRAFT_244925 [Didymella exigua CBS 183.55]KAF1932598.1 hypothetical protein M421DRAFT_244925 [Didymella exigua CBS 183.55]
MIVSYPYRTHGTRRPCPLQIQKSKYEGRKFSPPVSHLSISSSLSPIGCICLPKELLLRIPSSGKPVYLDKWFNYMAFEVIGQVVFSQRFDFLEAGEDLGGSTANLRLLVPYVTLAGFFRILHRLTVGNPLFTDWNLMPTQHILDTTLRALEACTKKPDVQEGILSLGLEQNERFS